MEGIEVFPMTVAARYKKLAHIAKNFEISECRGCNLKIWWLINADGKKKHPVNIEPDFETGNIALLLSAPGEFRIVKGEVLKSVRRMGIGQLFKSHLDTCINADFYRVKPKKRKK